MDKKYACPLPFNHMAVRPDGQIFPCCIFRWDDVPEDLNIYHKDPFNHNYMKKLRQDMLEDKPISGCSHCYDREKSNASSFRLEAWNEQEKYGTTSLSTGQEPQLRYVDLSISNTCNNKCRMCVPALSTHWYSDAKKLGLQIPKGIVRNPFIENTDFSTLSYIKLLGGEPLMEQNVLIKILKQCDLENLTVHLITNATLRPNEELLNLFEKCKQVKVTLSIDAYGDLNDFLRKGSDWKTTFKNLLWFLDMFPKSSVHSVLSIYNINKAKEFVYFCNELKKGCQKYFLIDGPDYMMPRHLPEQVKLKILESLQGIESFEVYEKELHKTGDFNIFVKQDKIMNNLRNEHWKDANPDLHNLVKEYII